jgi:hypothetical protein
VIANVPQVPFDEPTEDTLLRGTIFSGRMSQLGQGRLYGVTDGMTAPPQQPDQMVRWLCMGQGHP